DAGGRQMRTLAVLLILGAVAWAGEDDWPQFRGPTGQGVTPEKSLPLTWGGEKSENVAWKSPLIGEGHASPIVWKDRVYLTTVRWAEGKADPAVIPEHHVLCYAGADGKLLWDTVVPPGPWKRNDFRSGAGGGYAAPTPVTDGKHVFVVFGSSVMAALDLEGKIAWRQEIRPYTFDVTIGSSPLLYGETILLLCGMAKASDSRLVAFAKADGQVRWETKMPKVGYTHSTPLLIQVKEKPQLIVIGGGNMKDDALQSFDPADGRRLWWCKGQGDASSPAYGGDIVYTDSGRGGNGIAVDPTGEGDVSGSHVKWSVSGLGEAIGSPVIVAGHVVRLISGGVVRVWATADGKETDKQRLDKIGSSWASPIVDGNGRIYFASGGKSYVVQSGPQLKVLATNDLGDPNHCSPAVSNGRLFIAGLKHLYCISGK